MYGDDLTFEHTLENKPRSFLPDIQTYEVSPGENVVSAEHHPNVCHQDILQNGENMNEVFAFQCI